jgi:hypothetical protein
MKTLYQSLLLAISALTLAGTAFGQVPSTNDTSDAAQNTGMGNGALVSVTPGTAPSGWDNTASGFNALLSNTTGYLNTASGFQALYHNIGGSANTASGYEALFANNGNNNTASGYEALYNTTTGNFNTAAGVGALQNNTTGSNNIAMGYQGGLDLTTGSNNIDIGNAGVAAESNVIRIGTNRIQKEAFVAGIYNHTLTGNVVVVDSAGRLGVQAVSSERFKTAITPMGSNSAKLEQLRPVTFHLKTDPKGALQYGLIAEEVAKVYPELVVRDGTGRIDGVRYDELAPMLLNEVQQQRKQMTEKIDAQAAEIRDLKQQQKAVGEMQQQMAEMHAALLKLQTKDELVANR